MKSIIKKIIFKGTPAFIKNFYQSPIKEYYKKLLNYSSLSFSQEGEDLILKRIFENQTKGFYIDIGAHHPKRFSNTYIFYRMGWKGINIDPMPGSMKLFNELRPNDINLELGISDKDEYLTYYIFNEPALNTFSEQEAAKKDGLGNFKIIEKKTIKLERLDHILDKHLPINQEIDFLTIDVEGLDINVLKSNNWEKYSPKIVLVEALGYELGSSSKNELLVFMEKKGFHLFAKTFNTLFFKK